MQGSLVQNIQDVRSWGIQPFNNCVKEWAWDAAEVCLRQLGENALICHMGGGIGQTWHFLSQNGQYNAQSKIPTCLCFKGPNQTVQLCAASSSTPKKLGLLNCTKTGTPNYAPVNASQNFSCQSFSRNSVVMAFWSADSSTEYPILASNPVPGMLRTNQHQALLIEEILRHGWPGWLDPVTTPKTPGSKPL